MALHTLIIASHGIEFQLPVNARFTDIEYESGGKSIIPPGCRVGACGACLVRIISGIDTLPSRDDEEEAFIKKLGYIGGEYRLACQCRIKGEVAIGIVGR